MSKLVTCQIFSSSNIYSIKCQMQFGILSNFFCSYGLQDIKYFQPLWILSPTWSLPTTVCLWVGRVEQERWWSRVHKTNTLLEVIAILCFSQFTNSCHQVLSLFVAKRFDQASNSMKMVKNSPGIEPLNKKADVYQLLASLRFNPFYHGWGLSCTCLMTKLKSRGPMTKINTHLSAAWRKSTCPHVLHGAS